MRSEGPSVVGRLRTGDKALGALLPMSNPLLVEHAGHAGLDFVVLDAEHGPADQVLMSTHIAVARSVGLDVLVRVGHPTDIAHALDFGAAGIVAPHVSSVDEAAAVVDAVRHPPHGSRGFATYTRAGAYGRVPAQDHVDNGLELMVVAMIEDPTGVDAAPAIAAVDGISGLLLGPADFACALGVPGDWDHRAVHEARDRVYRAARVADKQVLAICADPAVARAHLVAGVNAVVYNVQGALSQLFDGLGSARTAEDRAHTMDHAWAGGRVPLLLLPGMLGGPPTWDEVAEQLLDVAEPRVGRIDLDDSIAEMATTVLASAPPRFALAGHSLGAIVALELVRRAPERVTHLALLNGSARAGSDEQQTAWRSLRDRLDTEPFADIAADMARANLPEHRRDDDGLVTKGEAMARRVTPDGLRRQLVAQATRPESRPHLAAISVPTVVVSGARDQVCPVELQEELVDGVPGAQHVVLPATGHMAPMEDPAAVAAALRRWLTGS